MSRQATPSIWGASLSRKEATMMADAALELHGGAKQHLRSPRAAPVRAVGTQPFAGRPRPPATTPHDRHMGSSELTASAPAHPRPKTGQPSARARVARVSAPKRTASSSTNGSGSPCSPCSPRSPIARPTTSSPIAGMQSLSPRSPLARAGSSTGDTERAERVTAAPLGVMQRSASFSNFRRAPSHSASASSLDGSGARGIVPLNGSNARPGARKKHFGPGDLDELCGMDVIEFPPAGSVGVTHSGSVSKQHNPVDDGRESEDAESLSSQRLMFQRRMSVEQGPAKSTSSIYRDHGLSTSTQSVGGDDSGKMKICNKFQRKGIIVAHAQVPSGSESAAEIFGRAEESLSSEDRSATQRVMQRGNSLNDMFEHLQAQGFVVKGTKSGSVSPYCSSGGSSPLRCDKDEGGWVADVQDVLERENHLMEVLLRSRSDDTKRDRRVSSSHSPEISPTAEWTIARSASAMQPNPDQRSNAVSPGARTAIARSSSAGNILIGASKSHGISRASSVSGSERDEIMFSRTASSSSGGEGGARKKPPPVIRGTVTTELQKKQKALGFLEKQVNAVIAGGGAAKDLLFSTTRIQRVTLRKDALQQGESARTQSSLDGDEIETEGGRPLNIDADEPEVVQAMEQAEAIFTALLAEDYLAALRLAQKVSLLPNELVATALGYRDTRGNSLMHVAVTHDDGNSTPMDSPISPESPVRGKREAQDPIQRAQELLQKVVMRWGQLGAGKAFLLWRENVQWLQNLHRMHERYDKNQEKVIEKLFSMDAGLLSAQNKAGMKPIDLCSSEVVKSHLEKLECRLLSKNSAWGKVKALFSEKKLTTADSEEGGFKFRARTKTDVAKLPLLHRGGLSDDDDETDLGLAVTSGASRL